MKFSCRKSANIFIGMLVFYFLTPGIVCGEQSPENLLPEGLVVSDVYEPGNGPDVGEIRQVSGEVIIIHKGGDTGYRAAEGIKLYKGDTLITLADGHVSFRLNDDSFITLSAKTTLVINKSVYAPDKKTRSAFVNMVLGKARFVVKKLVEARHSEFKVKTKTSVAGVRGSDFIVAAAENTTEITALENTELEVVSLAAPEAKPTVLHAFEKTSVRVGALPEEARKVGADEVDRLMKEFIFRPQETPAPAMEIKESPQNVQPESPPAEPRKVHVPVNALVSPRAKNIRPPALKRIPLDAFKVRTIRANEQKIADQQIDILQQKTEYEKIPMADFPGTP